LRGLGIRVGIGKGFVISKGSTGAMWVTGVQFEISEERSGSKSAEICEINEANACRKAVNIHV
jgi:hypothetical protein